MGGQMADHVYLAGFELLVFNRSPEKSERFRESGVPVAESLEMVGELCDQVFLCVRATEDVEDCLKSMSDSARPGTLFVDHSTILPSAAERFHKELSGKGMRFVDAPITGGSMGAAKGTLTIFCGGDPKDIYAATPVMNCYSKRSECVGGPGAGQKMKMANQIAVAGSLLGLCESLAFAEKAGLALSQTCELLSTGAAGSWAFDNYGPKILSSDWSPGFTIENQLKDLDYCEKAAKDYGANVPGSKLVKKLLSEMSNDGMGGQTTAALFRKLLEG
jgi:3-hydroxyisobutyrate dehydrogenase-like beta-hydroxyacid dehydrogenase